MSQIDFIFNQVYRGALKAGAIESSAHNAAVIGISEYKKGRFKSASALIELMIKNAKKRNT